jgi:hypothetical protein
MTDFDTFRIRFSPKFSRIDKVIDEADAELNSVEAGFVGKVRKLPIFPKSVSSNQSAEQADKASPPREHSSTQRIMVVYGRPNIHP